MDKETESHEKLHKEVKEVHENLCEFEKHMGKSKALDALGEGFATLKDIFIKHIDSEEALALPIVQGLDAKLQAPLRMGYHIPPLRLAH